MQINESENFQDNRKKLKILKQPTIEQFLKEQKYSKRKSDIMKRVDFDSQKFDNYQTRLPLNSGLNPKVAYDPETIKNWIYALNKSFREYQFNLVETALFNNTIVCLPTGLGKTFIAAIVILNYYLWFPDGKIFFLAPTRPLVNQQIDCLVTLDAIDQQDIIELNGSYPNNKRSELYKKKKIFFMTPQTLQNDLEENRYSGEDIVLIVIDEAHRATGKYSYCQVLNKLDQINIGFRVLALSATPGNDLEQIQQVITNLRISKLEVKDEEDPEVKPYVFKKDISPIMIKGTGVLIAIQDKLNQLLMQPYTWLLYNKLVPPKVISIVQRTKDLNRGVFFQIFQSFQSMIQENQLQLDQDKIGKAYQQIKLFSQLAHGKKVISEQGMECFQKWLDDFQETWKDKNNRENQAKKYMLESKQFAEFQECYKNNIEGKENHPKSQKLFEILKEFFDSQENIDNNSKVMVFTQNRVSAYEIKKFISSNPKVLAEVFIGQAKNDNQGNVGTMGMTQKQQLQIIKQFKKNELNVLIATCIGEEGLDIGEIDLIICYDNGFSPIRMIQRMGRTGRKRDGKVIVLLMEGKEYSSYMQIQKTNKQLMKQLKQLSSGRQQQTKGQKKQIQLSFYSFSPRMIPDETTPKLLFLTNQQDQKQKQEQDNFTELLLNEDEEQQDVVNKKQDITREENSLPMKNNNEDNNEEQKVEQEEIDKSKQNSAIKIKKKKIKKNRQQNNVNNNEGSGVKTKKEKSKKKERKPRKKKNQNTNNEAEKKAEVDNKVNQQTDNQKNESIIKDQSIKKMSTQKNFFENLQICSQQSDKKQIQAKDDNNVNTKQDYEDDIYEQYKFNNQNKLQENKSNKMQTNEKKVVQASPIEEKINNLAEMLQKSVKKKQDNYSVSDIDILKEQDQSQYNSKQSSATKKVEIIELSDSDQETNMIQEFRQIGEKKNYIKEEIQQQLISSQDHKSQEENILDHEIIQIIDDDNDEEKEESKCNKNDDSQVEIIDIAAIDDQQQITNKLQQLIVSEDNDDDDLSFSYIEQFIEKHEQEEQLNRIKQQQLSTNKLNYDDSSEIQQQLLPLTTVLDSVNFTNFENQFQQYFQNNDNLKKLEEKPNKEMEENNLIDQLINKDYESDDDDNNININEIIQLIEDHEKLEQQQQQKLQQLSEQKQLKQSQSSLSDLSMEEIERIINNNQTKTNSQKSENKKQNNILNSQESQRQQFSMQRKCKLNIIGDCNIESKDVEDNLLFYPKTKKIISKIQQQNQLINANKNTV